MIYFSERKRRLKAQVKRCQNWMDEFDQDFKEKCRTAFGGYATYFTLLWNFLGTLGFFMFTEVF